jgi:uncharacterized protein DUF3592
MNKLIGYLLGPVVCGMGIFAIVHANSEATNVRALNDHGAVAMAEVTRIGWKQKRTGGGQQQFTVDMEFVTDSKEKISVEDYSVPTDLGTEIKANNGATLKVRYLPEDPQKVDLVDYPKNWVATRWAGVAMAVLGAIFTWWKFRKISEDV